MRILSFSEYIDEGKKNPQRTVFSIGVFDGVHFGHKAILEDLRRLKKESGAECSAVFTFSTNPKGRKGDLDTLRLRAENIAEYDVDVLAVIDFSTAGAVDGLLAYCVEKKLPVVLCTTGLSEEQQTKVAEASKSIAVLKSANMSFPSSRSVRSDALMFSGFTWLLNVLSVMNLV